LVLAALEDLQETLEFLEIQVTVVPVVPVVPVVQAATAAAPVVRPAASSSRRSIISPSRSALSHSVLVLVPPEDREYLMVVLVVPDHQAGHST
jgi:hypothetical protein